MTEKSTGNHLLHFSEDEIRLNEKEARIVYEFFFGRNTTVMTALRNRASLDFMHIEFAQALLVEGLDASYAMGFVSSLLSALGGGKKTPSLDLKKILHRFGKKAGDHWFKHATMDDLWDDPEIHVIVRDRISQNFGTVASNMLVHNSSSGY